MTAPLAAAPGDPTARRSKLLTAVEEAATRHGHAQAAAAELADWCLRFILFHGKKHPQEMGCTEIGAYLQHVAATQKDALRAIASARTALEFLFESYLQRKLGELPLPKPPRLLDQLRQAHDVNALDPAGKSQGQSPAIPGIRSCFPLRIRPDSSAKNHSLIGRKGLTSIFGPIRPFGGKGPWTNGRIRLQNAPFQMGTPIVSWGGVKLARAFQAIPATVPRGTLGDQSRTHSTHRAGGSQSHTSGRC